MKLERPLQILVSSAFVVAAAFATVVPMSAQATRLKDIASVQGVRPNQLMGYGLIVGLDGTGDQTTRPSPPRA